MGVRELRRGMQKQINQNNIEDIAKTSGFKSRNYGKIRGLDFLWLSCFSGNNLCIKTLEELCASLYFLDCQIKCNINFAPEYF